MWPGAWVIANGGLEAMSAACGVTPQAQNTGTSPSSKSIASPKSGSATSTIPRPAGSPTCTGAPCTAGIRPVTCTAVGTSAAGTGRIDTTSSPDSRPAGRHCRFVRNMATFRPCSMLAHRDAGVDQGALEAERAADEERHEVIGPQVRDLRHLLDQLAVPPYAIERQVRAKVCVRGELGARRAGLGDIEQRHRLRVALAEQQHVPGPVARHDDEVRLGDAGRVTAGRQDRTGPVCRARTFRGVSPGGDRAVADVLTLAHAESRHSQAARIRPSESAR